MSKDMSMVNNLRNPGKHKQWLDNEYQQWADALNSSTVYNFKEHPMVRRMLSLDYDIDKFSRLTHIFMLPEIVDIKNKLILIKDLGGVADPDFHFYRMSHYAQVLMMWYANRTHIIEIGGGVGEFYAILRALGYKGEYRIYDLPDVKRFQDKYLAEVTEQTGLRTDQNYDMKPDLLVSFYALGEFDDETKESYRELISSTPHGYIAWNPHSGANDDLGIFSAHDIKVTPGIEPGIKIIAW